MRHSVISVDVSSVHCRPKCYIIVKKTSLFKTACDSGYIIHRRASLAWRPRSGVLQTGSDSSPVSERPRSTVAVGLLSIEPVTRYWTVDGCWNTVVAGADTRRQLRSSNRQLLAIPRYRLNTYGRRAFSVAGPKVWNSLPDFIRDPTVSADCFRRLLKTYLFALVHLAR